MSCRIAEAFISLIEMPEDRAERRDGLDRREQDIGSMEEKRSGMDRRRGFWPKDKPPYTCKSLDGVYDEYMRDHEFDIPVCVITDGEKIVNAPFGLLNDWLGFDFKKIKLDAVYVDPDVRKKILERTKDYEFSRFFPHILKLNGGTVILDVLITSKPTPDGGKRYFLLVVLNNC